MSTPVILSIAGSDSGAGAGIQADIKTIMALSAYAATAITAITAQNTLGVGAVFAMDAEALRAQIDAVLSDFSVAAIKIGMLPSLVSAQVVADCLQSVPHIPVVWDPVLKASSGMDLSASAQYADYLALLAPVVQLITPNLPEMARFLAIDEAHDVTTMQDQARALQQQCGIEHILLKGGHLPSNPVLHDVLLSHQQITVFSHDWIQTHNSHGTGCTLSSAIATQLAFGLPMAEAVGCGIDYLQLALQAGRQWQLGSVNGNGPLQHAVKLD